ncbi:MAG: asparagine synthase (glutamine-hydrolyzing) [Gammaproteobacteria bacterium]|nr:asparagine synthase (glutamine-hydrolyzing) [Gammaproteobacteria bacterium]
MCGTLAIGAGRSGDPAATIETMIARLGHRGPDGHGVWSDGAAGIGLGHTRLAVLDLSPAGQQPMASADGRWVITFNGEIYNHRVLRGELEARGTRFRGHCDTEVLVEACAIWGVEATLRRVNGMFAFGLWDRQARCLHLGRDRIGEKPLYYGHAGPDLVFASELGAIAAHPRFTPQVDRSALAAYLRYGCVPGSLSIHAGIRKLPPGCVVSVPVASSGEWPAPQPYWRLPEPATAVPGARHDDAAAIAQLDTLLTDAVATRLDADVPLGAFLSGGIDSSLVVALAQRSSSRPVQTFSIGFDVPGYDEAPFARAIAAQLGTDHHEIYVGEREAREVVPDLARIYAEPFADASQIPACLISRVARRQVTVVLSGDGGDELFGGYYRYFLGARIARWNRYVPAAIRRMAAHGLRLPAPQSWDRVLRTLEQVLPRSARPLPPGERMHKLADALEATDAGDLYRRLVSQWPDAEALVRGHAHRADSAGADAVRHATADVAAAMMHADLRTYLPDDLLVKLDRASMAVGLEARVPLLDHRVVEYAATLPAGLKLTPTGGKRILKAVLSKYLPQQLFERPKMGFAVPIDAWLRGPLRDWAEDLLDEQRLRREGWFEPGPIRQVWREHLSGRRNRQYALWTVLMFQAWAQLWRPAQ